MRGWTRPAWVAIALVVAFVAITAWWLTQDSVVPNGDAAEHLFVAFLFHDWLRVGELWEPLSYPSVYPPLTQLLGAVSVFVGGRSVATPIVAQNLVYVPLLALGCYRTARLLYGSLAGCLAVVFALGAPLIIEQFHVFMLDAPLAALVAVCVWLVLESDRFSDVRLAAIAGVVAGLGCLTKSPFPLYLVGLVVAVLLRERGWRNARGLVAFLLTAAVVAVPWYVLHAGRLGRLSGAAGANETVPALASPPLLSLANVEWYLWATLNGLLFAPLFLIAAIGVASAFVRVVRARVPGDLTPELLAGLGGAWLAITLMPHKDLRYTMPLVVFLAVLGTAWIARLATVPRRLAVAALLAAIAATTTGMTFGVGGAIPPLLPGARAAPDGEGVPPLRTVIVYSNHDFLVSGPRRSGNVMGLLDELRGAGATDLLWFPDQAWFTAPEFNHNGLMALARIAELPIPEGSIDMGALGPSDAFLIRDESFGTRPPCIRLDDGSGVWVRFGNPLIAGARDYCPWPRAGS